jgi:glyoxylase-like metal-dependent hydrolase (beta-lactamase superfamily II)
VTRLAALVDPELEMVEPMIGSVFEHGLRPAYIIDTHTDHVFEAHILKSRTVAKLAMHREAPCGAVDLRVEDGDGLHLDEPSVKLLHTPGHAKDLVGVVLPGRVLTADALLIGTCGRTNLLNGNATRQYHTLYHTHKSLPEGLEVYPGHDYQGRICSTLGDEKKNNPKMLFKDEEEFVRYMDLKNPKKLDPVEHLAEALRANMK